MARITLGRTGITAEQNAFGALPIQRVSMEEAGKILNRALDGGMDFIMDYRLVYCLRNGLPLDMDVYDLAEWCCISELSAISCEHGGAPVAVPDFTRGSWKK